jgi:hypothetical protein
VAARVNDRGLDAAGLKSSLTSGLAVFALSCGCVPGYVVPNVGVALCDERNARVAHEPAAL